MVPRLVSASTACCRPRLPTLSAALRSDLQNRKGHEDLHVFMHDGKMRPNRSKFDRQAPTKKALVGNFTEKKKGRARDVNSSKPSTTPTRCDLLQTSDQLQLSERKPTSAVRDLGLTSSLSTTHDTQGRFFPFHSPIFDLICLQLDLIYSRNC